MIEPTALQRYSLFGGLLKEQIGKILPFMEYESYAPGECIIAEGVCNDRIRFILEGRVAVVKGGLILYEFGEGDEFGEMEVLDIMPSVAAINAMLPTTAISISNKALHQIYKADISIFSMLIMNLARDLSRRLRKMDEKVASESPFLEWS
ncbi:Crp/Fnr family transcriptional regulator [Leadbettera azotonutricia]|uniref:Cyclic nucleotide-binding protein n=1 Tax=Leadbettera azotonutricia (strain ATCC BAA-888 / DSM 13862 / ZAS-9) TaxID=545695 RepID=F5YFZ4_LEAAZ|nr:cyclic nucleotide-binding domain-containing protein [Leadbettera azotonutricia]AEF82851.1 cyclic nucleotide-binding protein [Leadbettera azotonutricia ZAS-9]